MSQKSKSYIYLPRDNAATKETPTNRNEVKVSREDLRLLLEVVNSVRDEAIRDALDRCFLKELWTKNGPSLTNDDAYYALMERLGNAVK